MNDLSATESEPKRRHMSVSDELLLAILPTGTVLVVIAVRRAVVKAPSHRRPPAA